MRPPRPDRVLSRPGPGAWSPVPLLSSSLLGSAALLAAFALLGGCSLLTNFDPNDLREDSTERCTDGVDNDENGLTDCAEPSCQLFEFCQELSPEACRDRVDNDLDDLVDCLDPDCHGHLSCNESLQGACADGLDNNGDGLTDCQDFTCSQDPRCCHLVVTLGAGGLGPGQGGCQVEECDEESLGSQCNAFDAAEWMSFGAPAPRAGGEGFDPNQCAACVTSGRCPPCRDAALLSVARYTLKPGFGMGALLRLGGGPRDRAGLALTFQDTVAEAGPCASDEPELDRFLGVSLETDGASPLAHQVRFVVDQETQLLVPWNGAQAAAFVRVDDEGFARFYLGDALEPFPAWDAPPMHRSMRVLSLGGPPMRLALHGHGSGPRVTGLLVQDGGRCGDPIPEPREALGLGAVFAAGSTGDASGPAAQEPWDAQVVSEPAVASYRGELHLFYRGRPTADAPGAIGQAVWGGDGVGFVRLWGAPVIDDDWVRQSATSELGPILDLSGPAALVRDEDGALLLYFGVSEILEDEPARSWIGGALISEDGDAIPLYRTSPSGAPTHELLSPKQGVVPSWERSVSQPSVVQRGQGDFLMLYTGRADPVDPFTAAIGLAVSSDGVSWRRGNILPAGDPRGENQPVIRTPLESAHMTAVSSPTFVWDAHMEVFRVWYVHRAGADFSLHHAVSGMDARVFRPYPGNPVLRPASFEWCDDHYLDGPSVLVEPSGLLRLYYHGRSETLGHSICYAENGFGF